MPIYKNISGYADKYAVTDDGRVYSEFKQIYLAERKCSGGYPRVCLYTPDKKRKDIRVHRLVAEYFLENPENLPCVNHIDDNKTNNNVSNLEWCTHQHNVNHAFETGLTPKKQRLLSPEQLQDCARKYLQGVSIKTLALYYNVSRKAIEEHILRNSAVALAGKTLHKELGSVKTGKALSKRVAQYTKEGVFIAEWDSMLQAATALNINVGNISNVTSGRQKSCGGFIWQRV